ncbi:MULTISPECIES: glycosyltransferase [unclassified Mycolicibacterium]|uniref:glycosyltransferase n=1 Tax=unclassified Mycolicibacterium TaxID=2636767 RepID=UPI002ED8DE42
MATVAIIAIGSRGDVAPLTGIGIRLRQAGHRVIVLSYGLFRELITGCGLEFRSIDVDDDDADLSDTSTTDAIRGLAAFLSPGGMRKLGAGILAALHDKPLDLLMLTPFAELVGHPLAEALGVPSVGARLQPLSASAEYPPAVLGAWSGGRFGNRATARCGERLIDGIYRGTVNRFRADLGLPKASPHRLRVRRTESAWPILYGYSPAVVPRPADWRPGIDVVGYWWPARPDDWEPPADLLRFIDAGPAPVVVGFGSTVNSVAAAEQVSLLVRDALRAAGVRGVIQSGWAGLTASGDDVISVGEVPHDWLFGRAAAVVHHCGAGTTAAGLRAGVPAIAVPNLGDQPFWARRLSALGVGPTAIPYRRLTTENLAATIRMTLSDSSYRDNAVQVAGRIRDEDGAGRVLAVIEELLT